MLRLSLRRLGPTSLPVSLTMRRRYKNTTVFSPTRNKPALTSDHWVQPSLRPGPRALSHRKVHHSPQDALLRERTGGKMRRSPRRSNSHAGWYNLVEDLSVKSCLFGPNLEPYGKVCTLQQTYAPGSQQGPIFDKRKSQNLVGSGGHGLKPAVPWWFHFDPYPSHAGWALCLRPGRRQLLHQGPAQSMKISPFNFCQLRMCSKQIGPQAPWVVKHSSTTHPKPVELLPPRRSGPRVLAHQVVLARRGSTGQLAGLTETFFSIGTPF